MEQRHIMKEQADWLLSNIIPDFVIDKLKSQQKYSENHSDVCFWLFWFNCKCRIFVQVAVLFASVVNWSDMYEESYLQGREFLRVLNELMGDFDEVSWVAKVETFYCEKLERSLPINGQNFEGFCDQAKNLLRQNSNIQLSAIIITQVEWNLLYVQYNIL